MLTPGSSHAELRERFRWDLPASLNMAAQACDRPAEEDPGGIAIVEMSQGGRGEITRARLREIADGLAHALVERGVAPGDRVGVLRGQGALCAAAHVAIWKIGAVSMPLFKLFKRNALESRIGDSGARIVVAEPETAELLDGLAEAFVPDGVDLPRRAFETADAGPETPGVLIYTSGTTGGPKGVLHGHRVLSGHLPGVEISHDFLGRDGDCIWTPADWAWIGGLFDVLMPGLALRVPVVASRMRKFDPAECAELVRAAGVRNTFLPPTALRMLKAADTAVAGLRSVASGGEPLGAEMLEWGRGAFGLEINEFYGQTECNMIVSGCASLFPARPGFMGRAVPGHDVAVIGPDGQPAAGEGDIAVRRGSASMMLEYWNRPEETEAKFRGDWMVTGDRGALEGEDLRFVGREDDVISSAGYRIGPAEIEDCLLSHPAVATVGVVGKPDSLRTEIVKAYVVAKEGYAPGEELAHTLSEHVRERLAAHCHPREVAFLDALPMTVTGKVIRKDLKAMAAREGAG